VHRYLGSLAQSDPSETNKARRHQIRQAFGQLADHERRIIELRSRINGQAYTFTDIAQLLTVSPSVISRRYYRALKQLTDNVHMKQLIVEDTNACAVVGVDGK
jgi:DNA-directed RNA polymerase specialized sigma subunit